GRIIRVVVIEVGFDILRMIKVAVVTLAVVFPDQLPVRLDEVIDGPGHLRAVQPLRLQQRGQSLIRWFDRNRFLSKRNENQTSNLASVNSMQPELRLVEVWLHPTAGQQRPVESVCP